MNNIKFLFTKPDTTTQLRDLGANFWPESYQIRIVNNNITHRTEDGNINFYTHVPTSHIFEIDGEWHADFAINGQGFLTDATAYTTETMSFYDNHANVFAGLFWSDDQSWDYSYPGIQDAQAKMSFRMIRPGNSEVALTVDLDAFGTDLLRVSNYRTALSATDSVGGRSTNYFSGVNQVVDIGFPRLTNAKAMEILSKIGFSNFYTVNFPANFITPGATGTTSLNGRLDADEVVLRWKPDDPDYWALEGFKLLAVTT